jgi:hypothetical protein
LIQPRHRSERATRWQVRAMTSKIRILRASLTGFAGIVGVGVTVVVVAAVCLLPLPSYTAQTAPTEVFPIAGEQSRVCAGPLLQIVPQAGDETSYFATGEPTVFTDSLGASAQTRALKAIDVAQSGSAATPEVISVPPAAENETQPLVAGIQLEQTVTEELAGLAAAACTDASSDSWLVGGATDVGRTTLILLSNPTEVTATVSLEIFGDNGAVSAPGADGILVQPGQQRVLSLAAYAPDLISPVVHVTSSGGLVQAALQHSIMRALVPGGVEIITPSAAPNTTQIMTGVALTGLAAQDSGETGLITNDLEPTIRIVVPGAEAADVVLTVIGEGVEPVEIRTTIEARHTLQLPFTGITDGVYTVVVTGTKPLVAGVRSVQAAAAGGTVVLPSPVATVTPATPPTGGGEGFNGGTSEITPQEGQATAPSQSSPATLGGDFAWHSSAQPLTGDTLIAVAAGPNATLSLFNPSQATITATLSTASGDDVTVTVKAGAMTTVSLRSGTRYMLSEGARLHAAVTYADAGLGSSVALSPTNQRGAAIKVFPR